MKKNVTCGILIYLKKSDKLILGKSTGNNHFDIPKGMYEDSDKTPIAAAIRECKEEFGLVFAKNELLDLGRFPYNSAKDIHLFLAKTDYDESIKEKLFCESCFEHYKTKRIVPEIEYYRFFNRKEMLECVPRSLKRVLVENRLLDF